MSNVKKQLNEIAQYPHDAYVSSRRMALLMAEVLDECSNRQQISLYADNKNLYMRNNIKLHDNEYLYLMRKARRAYRRGDNVDNSKKKRWTFCWQGSAIYCNQNIAGGPVGVNQPLEFVLPELECRCNKGGETTIAAGSVLDVIKQLSIEKRDDSFFINSGMRTRVLKDGKPITAHFAIALAQVSGKHADKANHSDYCRQCDRQVMMMARFKVTFSLADGEVLTKVSID